MHTTRHGYTLQYRSFDDASMFAQMDAFAQRCSDLLEICEGQIQFARKATATNTLAPTATTTASTTVTNSTATSSSASSTLPLPEFGGTRGQEVGKALLGIQVTLLFYNSYCTLHIVQCTRESMLWW
jgi:dynein heavy chain, axonemal